MILLFFCFLMHRFLSGWRNGLIYREGERARDVVTGIALAMPLMPLIAVWGAAYLHPWPFGEKYALWIVAGGWLFGTLATIVAVLPHWGVNNRFVADLHLWTLAEQTAFSGLLCAVGPFGLIAAVCGVYPAVVVQKITINLISGLPWNYHGTDNPTGETFGVPALGIQVPRMGFNIRIVLAVVSLAAVSLLNYLLNA